jgi:hypothetical protein
MRHRKRQLFEVALVAVAAGVTLLATLVAPGGGGTATPSFAPPILGGQPAGAVVQGAQDKDLAVGLAVKPGSPLTLVATVLGQDGTGTDGLDVNFGLTTRTGATGTGTGRNCGPGCYETTINTTGPPRSATVTVNGPGASGRPLTFAMPAQWPPVPAAQTVLETEAAYRKLTSLVTHERLASDPTHVANTVYEAVAPDRLRIKTTSGHDTIVIGKTRWDRQPDGKWAKTLQSATSPSITPYWGGTLEDVMLLGTTRIAGRPAWIVSFAAPQFPAFFTVWIDRKTHRALKLHMTASAHFMQHAYGPFNTPIKITPPK